MAKHLKQDIYQDLLHRLTFLFPGTPTTTALSTLADSGELEIGRINFIGDGFSVWDRILSRAESEDKVDRLLIGTKRFSNDDLVNGILNKVQSGEAFIAPANVDLQKSGVVKDAGRVRVFINYDKSDEACKSQLLKIIRVLALLPDPFPVDFFDVETDSTAGLNRPELIKQEIEKSDIVLLLISIDFMTGPCYNTTLMAADLKKYLAPVVVRPCPVERIKTIAPLQMLPRDGKPLSQREESVYNIVAEEIFELIKKIYTTQAN